MRQKTRQPEFTGNSFDFSSSQFLGQEVDNQQAQLQTLIMSHQGNFEDAVTPETPTREAAAPSTLVFALAEETEAGVSQT
jgi:hypothetical protein